MGYSERQYLTLTLRFIYLCVTFSLRYRTTRAIMDILCESFERISLDALAARQFYTLKQTFATIAHRYPNLDRMATSAPPSLNELERYSGIRPPKAQWVEYVSRNESQWEGDGDTGLSKSLVEEYLKLLTSQGVAQGVTISEVKQIHHQNTLQADKGHTTIFPFQTKDAWAFAVVYHDCIHWYDSSTSTDIPCLDTNDDRKVTNSWKGPKHNRKEDSGIFMLMGIKSIVNGGTHLDQESADALAGGFRACVIIETECQTLDPTDDCFQRFLSRIDGTNSHFFDEAMYGLEESEPSLVTDASSPASPESPVHPIAPSPISPYPLNPPRSYSLTVVRGLPSEADARYILHNLSCAVRAVRLYSGKYTQDINTLWQLGKSTESLFYNQYIAALLYEKIQGKTDAQIRSAISDHAGQAEIKKRRAHGKILSDICSLRNDWGDMKYALILAVPSGKLDRSYVSDLANRLDDPQDPLEQYVQKTHSMLRLILTNTIPNEYGIIEFYTVKKHEFLTEELYDAYMTFESTRVPIPRISSRV